MNQVTALTKEADIKDAAWLDEAIQRAVVRTRAIDASVVDFPHITQSGAWQFTPDGVWTGGFWAGLLWLAYEQDGDQQSRERASHFTDRLLPRALDANNHDLGFMFVPSAVKGWQLTGNTGYRDAAITAARSLAKQYNADAGFIPGWGFFGGDDWGGNVLVDTLMNLPLLVWASQQTEDPSLLTVVRGHTETALRYVMREDGSVYHMYRFAPDTGAPIAGDTYQGYAPETTWSRGQAWALTGLAMLGGSLGDQSYVEASERAATYFAEHLPADGIPPWDFGAPDAAELKDASAGAIASYGFQKLFEATGRVEYLRQATALLKSAFETCSNGDAPGGLLLHSTADRPHGLGIDESTMYGDYYYLKSLVRLKDKLAGA